MEKDPGTAKTNTEVITDYAKEIVGYDNGLLRTLIDLRKHPEIVLASYLNNERKYVSPFRILISALSLWVLVNSFFLDWYALFENLMHDMAAWMQEIRPTAPEKKELLNRMLAATAKFYGRIAGDLFSKYYVPFVLVGLPLASYLASKKCKHLGVTFKSLLAALAYSFSLNVLIMFMISVSAYFNVFITFTVVAVPVLVLMLTGKGNLIAPLPLRKFFGVNGVEIEKKATRSMVISTCVLLLPGMLFMYYYMYAVIYPSVK